MVAVAHARKLSTEGLMRVRHCATVSSERYVEQMEWLLRNFDFRRGRILVNAVEDIEYFEGDIKECIRRCKISTWSTTGHILHTYYFADDELGMMFRLKFV